MNKIYTPTDLYLHYADLATAAQSEKVRTKERLGQIVLCSRLGVSVNSYRWKEGVPPSVAVFVYLDTKGKFPVGLIQMNGLYNLNDLALRQLEQAA